MTGDFQGYANLNVCACVCVRVRTRARARWGDRRQCVENVQESRFALVITVNRKGVTALY